MPHDHVKYSPFSRFSLPGHAKHTAFCQRIRVHYVFNDALFGVQTPCAVLRSITAEAGRYAY
ncbi:hypothetical protein RSAG8_01083, partial [Rhizoctonia solani AG-8 WAC10335]